MAKPMKLDGQIAKTKCLSMLCNLAEGIDTLTDKYWVGPVSCRHAEDLGWFTKRIQQVLYSMSEDLDCISQKEDLSGLIEKYKDILEYGEN